MPLLERQTQFCFDQGTEPDPRFSLANERTFLAWFRTGITLLALGIAAAGRAP